MLNTVKKWIVEQVLWAEQNLKGKSGAEKRETLIEKFCDWIDVPYVPEFVERPIKRWVAGYFVDLAVEKWNWLTNWAFEDVAATPEQVDKVAACLETPIPKLAAASRAETLDERLEALCREYKVVPVPDSEPDTGRAGAERQPLPAAGNTDDFPRCVALTLKWEGGYVDDPDDRGGETNRGITAGALAAAIAQGIVPKTTVKDLTRGDAERIYRANYWDRYGWGEMPWPVCLCLFDITVNHGGGGMAKIAQRACNRVGGTLVVDGKYGPKTRSALLTLASPELAQALCDERKAYYDGIIKAAPTQEKFRKGWYNRLRDMAQTAGVKSPV